MIVTLDAFRIAVFVFGILLASATAWLAYRTPPERATQVRVLGSSTAIIGWLLFLAVPSFDGALNAPALVIIAAAYPLVAVEAGRGTAMRLFCWSSLIFCGLGCACYWVLSVSARNIDIQERLLMLGASVPPLAAMTVGAWQGMRRLIRPGTDRTRAA